MTRRIESSRFDWLRSINFVFASDSVPVAVLGSTENSPSEVPHTLDNELPIEVSPLLVFLGSDFLTESIFYHWFGSLTEIHRS